MSIPPLPSSAGDLTAELLNQHLANAGKWELGPFESIESAPLKIVPLGGIDSMSRAVFKITGQLSSGDSMTLIVKSRNFSGSPSAQQGSRHEVIFYRDLADIAGVDSPEAYVAVYDDETDRMLVVLEYLEDGEVGTIKTNLDVSQIDRITTALAGMHAKWWNSPDLAKLSQVRTFEQVMEGGAKLFKSGVFSGEKFLEQYGDLVHPDIYKVYSSPSQWGPRLQAGFSGNRTLCNYDVAAKNLFLPSDPAQPPKFFDWELLIRGSIGVELAVILAYSLRVEDHGKMFGLLDHYLETMYALGITDLTKDVLWNDVRHGFLVRLAAPIALAGRGHQSAVDLALEILPRITSAVLASDALELLE